MFERGLSQGFKGGLSQLVEHQREVPRGHTLSSFRLISVKAVQKTSEVFILANVQFKIAYHVSNGRSIAFNSTGLQISFFEKV